MIILPTGYGKSLIFELLPRICCSKVLIVTPLNAIIQEQVQRLEPNAMKIDGKILNSLSRKEYTEESTQNFLRGNVRYVFSHPENVVNKHVCEVFKGGAWNAVSHVIIDEAHCVVQWGQDFRPDFQQLSKLRSIFPTAYFVTMTATATVQMQKEISKILCMKKFNTVSTNVDRENVKIIVRKRLPSTGGRNTPEDAFDEVMGPIIDKLYQDVDSYPRTIVYTKLKWCGYGYSLAKRKALELNTHHLIQRVSQFHASCTDKSKVEVTKDMSTEEGKIKLLFATEAYGMGADPPDVHQVIHIGPPSSLETYLQEVGRAGRDGQGCSATLFFNMNDIGTPHVKNEVKSFCLLDSCRRKFISEHFGYTFNKLSQMHECCDICEKSCPCDNCFAEEVNKCEIVSPPAKRISKKQKLNELSRILLAFFEDENKQYDVPFPEIITGLSKQTADKIASLATQLTSVTDIRKEFPNIAEEYTTHILSIITFCNSTTE